MKPAAKAIVKTMHELWLVRHGTTDWNVSGKIQGHADIPLNAKGEADALTVREKLREMEFDGVWCSDLVRARRTAQLAGFPQAMPDRRLRELDFGGCEGLTWNDLDGITREDLIRYDDFAAPAGESTAGLTRRVTEFVSDLPDGRHLIFTHGGVVRAVLHECGNPAPQLANGSISRVWWEKRRQLGRLCLYTGGARCGKSARALRTARGWGRSKVSFLATAEALDEEMRLRVKNHQKERADFGWETIECPRDAGTALRRAQHHVCLLDCLTLFVSNLLLQGGAEAVEAGVDDLLLAWRETGKDLVVVTNEVGWGIVPGDALSRDYRDALGRANCRLMEAATEGWLCAAGRALNLKPVIA